MSRIVKNKKALVNIDWTGVQGETPFYDFSLYDNAGGYGVAVDTGIIRYDDPEFSTQQNDFLLEGTNKILDFYSKARRPPSDVYAQIPPDVTGTFVPLRPSGTIKVLVTIPDTIVDNSANPTEIIFDFGKLPRKARIQTVGAFDEVQLNTWNFTKKAKNISKLLRKYDKQAKNFEGRVYDFNFEQQAIKVVNVASLLSGLIVDNKFSYAEDQSNLIMLGLDSNRLPFYAQIYQNLRFSNLDYGFEQFQQSKYIDANTMNIYKHFDKINQLAIDSAATAPAAAGNNSTGWQKFLNQYVMFPTASIEYSRGRTMSPEPNAAVNKEIAKSNNNPVINAQQLERDAAKWKDPAFLQKTEERQKASREWVGDNVLGNLDKTLDQMHKLEDYYDKILDKVGITYIVRAALKCLALDLPIGDIKEFLLDARNFTSDVIKILKRPVVKLNDLIPTVDIMADLIKAVFWAVYEAVKKALWQMLKSIIYTLLDNCGDPCASFGGINLGNLMAKGNLKAFGAKLAAPALAGVKTGLQPGNAGANATKFLNNLNQKVPTDRMKTIMAPTAGAQQDFSNSPLGKFFDQASASLTCGETNKILEGKASPAAIKILKELAEKNDLGDLLSDPDTINNFFENVGKVIDQDELAAQIEEASEFFPNPTGCLTDREDNELRCALLMKKGVSKEWCERQAKGSADRAKDRIDQLQTFLDDPSKTLQDTLPPIYCTYDKDTGELIEGLVPNDHPSFKFMLRTTLDTTFGGIYNAFTYDVLRVPDMMQQQVSQNKTIHRVIPAPYEQGGVWVDAVASSRLSAGTKMINPEFEMAMREGYQVGSSNTDLDRPFWKCPPNRTDEDGNVELVADFREKTIQYNEPLTPLIKPENKVVFCPGMSGDDGVYTNFQTGYLFPRLPENRIARKNLEANSGTLQLSLDNTTKTDMRKYGPPGAVDAVQRFQNEANNNPLMRDAMGSSGLNNIFGPDRYVLALNQFADPPHNKDKFSMRIVGDSAGSVADAEIYHKLFITEIADGAKEVIRQRGLATSLSSFISHDPNYYSGKEKHFTHFLEKIWINGENIYVEGALSAEFDEAGSPVSQTTGQGLVLAPKPDYGRRFIDNLFLLSGELRRALLDDQDPSKEIKSLYEELLRDLMASCLTEVKNSKLLDPKYNPTSAQGNQSNFFSLINFAPFPKPNCPDLMLLELDNIKSDVLAKYEDALCMERSLPNVSGLGDNRDNAFERAALSGIVLTTIRTYAVEMVLKTMVTFSELQVEDLDEVFVVYLREHLMAEIRAKGYLDDFMAETLKAYNLLNVNRAVPLHTPDSLVAVDWFIKEQMKFAVRKLLAVSGLAKPNMSISDLLIKDDNSKFLEGWLPDFQVGQNIREVARDPVQGPEAFHVESATEILGIKDWLNGSLVLEKYVRAGASRWGVTEVGGNQDPTWQTKAEEYTGVFGLEEFERMIARLFGGHQNWPPLEPVPNTLYDPGTGAWTRFVKIEADDCTEQEITIGVPVDEIPGSGEEFRPLPDFIGAYFTTLRYGLRLVCKTGDNMNLETVMNPTSNEGEIQRVANYNQAKADKNKSYHVMDNIEPTDETAGIIFPLNRWEFPIVCVEKDMSEVRHRSPRSVQLIPVDTTPTNFVNQYRDDYNAQLIQMLKNTNEYSFMFEYCFPLKRLVSMCVLYNAVYVLPYSGLNDVFTNTKEQLRTAFLSMLKSGNYKYKDMHWTQKKMTLNIANGAEMEGLDYGQMALKFLMGLMKGFGEAFSPNLMIARKIQIAAKKIGPLLVKAVNKAKEIGNRSNELAGGSPNYFGAPITECDLPFEIPDLPIILIAFGLLPMDVFIYPPGPPLTLLALYYLPLFGWDNAPGNLILGLPEEEKEKLRCELRDLIGAPNLLRNGDAFCQTPIQAEDVLSREGWGEVPGEGSGRGIYPDVPSDESPEDEFPEDEFSALDEDNLYAEDTHEGGEQAGEELIGGDIPGGEAPGGGEPLSEPSVESDDGNEGGEIG